MQKIYMSILFSALYLALLLSTQTAFAKETIDSAYIVRKYSEIADKILAAATKDSSSWDRLAYMCDTFGPRLSGSENLENAIRWMLEEMKRDGFDNVRADSVMVPHWVRGNEKCELVSPRRQNINLLGLGGSIGTPKEGITAEVYVVGSIEELEANKDKAKGKIVVYDYKYQNYGQAVRFRFWGAVPAANAGAVASLIRPVTPEINQNPHTGMMVYADSVPKIPHASITGEDASMLHRMQERGQTPVVHLYMEAKTLPDTLSYNVMCEIKGSEKPEEIIAFGGHLDSWDAGTGAHDDASGCVSAWEALKLLKELGLKPRRTLRAVAWANEENGVRGGKAYAEKYKNEKHVLMFEFDSGLFPPETIGFNGPDSLYNIVRGFEPLLQKIDSVDVRRGGGGVDIGPMMKLGVPGMSLNTRDNGKYFWYHHSPTDTVDKIDPLDLNKCIAAIALSMYIYSDLP